MLHEHQWNLREYADRLTMRPEYQLDPITSTSSTVLEDIISYHLNTTTTGIISVFYWLWKASEVMNLKTLGRSGDSKQSYVDVDDLSCLEDLHTPICATMLELSATAPRLIAAVLLASKRANEVIEINEAPFYRKRRALDGELFEYCLSFVKRLFPTVYAFAYDLLMRLPEHLMSGDAEERDWFFWFGDYMDEVEVTCIVSKKST